MFVQVVQYVQRRGLLQIFRQAAVEGDHSYIFWPQGLSEICYQFFVCTVAILYAQLLARKTGALFVSMSGHVKCVVTSRKANVAVPGRNRILIFSVAYFDRITPTSLLQMLRVVGTNWGRARGRLLGGCISAIKRLIGTQPAANSVHMDC